jgi:hypothetical protein
MDQKRVAYFKVPKGGLPAVPEHGWPALPQGTILKAKKAGYGLKDPPSQWYVEHADKFELPGCSRSKSNPSLFLFRDADGLVDGLIGVHVDDDLIRGSDRFFAEVTQELKKRFGYGRWHTANKPGEGFEHCDKNARRGDDGRVVVPQRNHGLSVENLYLDTKRRRTPEARATLKERHDLRSGCGKIVWLSRGAPPDLGFRLAASQHCYNDEGMTVKSNLGHNKLANEHLRCDLLPGRRWDRSRCSDGRLELCERRQED